MDVILTKGCPFCGGKIDFLVGTEVVGCCERCGMRFSNEFKSVEQAVFHLNMRVELKNEKVPDFRKKKDCDLIISAIVAHKMLRPFARNFNEYNKMIFELRENARHIVLGSGKRTRRYYVKSDVEDWIADMDKAEDVLW